MKIVKIGAIWCPGCLVMDKIWKSLQKQYSDIEFIELDYDMNREDVDIYQVGSVLPVFIFLNPNEITRLVGEKKEIDFIDIINKFKEK